MRLTYLPLLPLATAFTFTINNNCTEETTPVTSRQCEFSVSASGFYWPIGPSKANISIPAIDFNLNTSDAADIIALASSYQYVGRELRSTWNTTLGTPFIANETLNGFIDANGDACAKVTVLYARGTAEVGNVGSAVGPPFFAALAGVLGKEGSMVVQGVDYTATVEGYLSGGSHVGSVNMASLAMNVLARCPKTQLVLSGYSQGAQVLHHAIPMIPKNTTRAISSIVMFGDPMNNTAIGNITSNKVLSFCHDADGVCGGGGQVGRAHLNYGALDAHMAAKFVAGQSKLGIDS